MNYIYHCKWMSEGSIQWKNIEGVRLVDNISGQNPRLKTTVKACWTEDYLHFLFECEDDHIIATYDKRDDPIYYEDVVEIFIDESGKGIHYKEFEVSPRNVVFDALIENRKNQNLIVKEDWDAEGLLTKVISQP